MPAAIGIDNAWTPAGTLRVLQIVADAGHMDRRNFIALLGASITSPAHEWLIAHPVTRPAQTTGTTVPGSVVEHLDDITAQLRRMDDQVGGGQLLRLVHEHLRYVTALLRNGRYDDSTGRRLHATAAELLRLAGFTAFDSGQHGLAQRYWIAGLRAAHTAGDRALGANIIGFMSCQAKDLDGGREALVLAGSARQGYPGASGKVTAILALRTAEAIANDQTATTAHRSSETQRAIDDAFTALDSDPPSLGHPAWAYWMTPAQAHAQAGYCHLTTGDFTKARSELRTALHLQGDESSREGALRNVLLATTYLKQRQPDLDRTLTHAHNALNAPTDHVDSTRCRGHLSRLAAGLRCYRTTGVQDFLDRHTSLTAAKHLRQRRSLEDRGDHLRGAQCAEAADSVGDPTGQRQRPYGETRIDDVLIHLCPLTVRSSRSLTECAASAENSPRNGRLSSTIGGCWI